MGTKHGRPPSDPGKTKGAYLEVRLSSAEKLAFQGAAELAGLELSSWVRERLTLAAREESGGLARGSQSILVPVATLDPEPYLLTRELTALVLPDEDAYVASLVDANINASGETIPEAIANLKDMMIRLFERLSKEPKERLGKWPGRQLGVLRGLMRRKARHAAHQ